LKRVRAFPDASFCEVVRPHVDTLCPSAFLDLRPGPLLVELPAQDPRCER
jgi:hypothetical protein